MHRWQATALAVALWASPGPTSAQGADSLTLDEVLVEARSSIDTVLQARVDAARGRMRAASVWLQDNPTLEARSGPSTQNGAAGQTEVEWLQPWAPGRGARVDGARAGIDHALASRDDVLRRLEAEVSAAFYRTLHAGASARLAAAAESVAVAVARVAERRHAAGDAPRLEVDLAHTALSRARAESHAARAARAAAAGDLQGLLGREPGNAIAVRGDLADRTRFERIASDLAASERPPHARADLRMLAADLRENDSARRAGSAARWPRWTPGVAYRREDGGDAVLGILGVELPLFERGQSTRAVAAARERELRTTLARETHRAGVEVRAALGSYRQYAAAADTLAGASSSSVARSETMAHRAYEVGQIPLGELLLVRRELLETRRDHLDRLLDAALAGVALQAAAGGSIANEGESK